MSLQPQVSVLINYLNSQADIIQHRSGEKISQENLDFQTNGVVYIYQKNNQKNVLVLRSQQTFVKLGLITLVDSIKLENELFMNQNRNDKFIHLCDNPQIIGSSFYVKEMAIGRVFTNQTIQSIPPKQNSLIVKEIISFLSRVHNSRFFSTYNSFNYKAYIESLRVQYKLNETQIQTNIEDLIYWLELKKVDITQQLTLCLGNVEINNFIFDQSEIKIINIQNWDQVNLGNPLLELSSFLSNYEIPYFKNITEYGISNIYSLIGFPSKEQIINQYCISRQLDTVQNINYNTILVLLQRAIVKQMQIKQKQSDSELNMKFQKELEILSGYAWNMVLELTEDDPFSIKLRAENDKILWSNYPVSQRCKSYYYRIRDFMRDEVYPLEKSQFDIIAAHDEKNHWEGLPGTEHLQRRAKSMGLWNLFISDPIYGKGLTNIEYAFLSELMGMGFFGHEIFNCYAPETGNIKLLIQAGTEYQKQKYLQPLLEGECKSFFAMSEKNVASSDPTNFQTTITKQGDGYVINGSKWMVSGIQDKRCKFGIVMGKTKIDPKQPFTEQTMFLIDTPNPNIKFKHPLQVLGFDEAPHGIVEVEFNNVYVPKENMLGKEGTAFAMSQGRLLGGRLHHSVRLLGLTRRSIDVLLERAQRRIHRGRLQKDDSAFQEKIGRIEINYSICKTMILNAAMIMDALGGRHMSSLKAVSETKAFVPYQCQCIVDECIQLFGSQGLTSDFILQIAYTACRGIRLMDGPCELHKKQVARFTQGSHMFNELLNADGYIQQASL